MGVVNFISFDDKDWYGTNQCQDVEVLSITPIQIIGLVPVELETEDCRGNPCEIFCVFEIDFSYFLFQWAIDTPDIDDYRIEKFVGGVWTEIVTGNPNNTLGSESGEKFTFGSFPAYPFYSGYKVDWGKIEALHGVGTYRFKVHNLFDALNPLLSPPYNLKLSSCDNLDNFYKLTCTARGKFRNWKFTESNGALRFFDVINMEWNDEVRLSGKLDEETIESEETYVKYGTYENRLHLTDDVSNFNLKSFNTTIETYKRLYLYGLRSHDIRITDTNKDATFNFTKIDVISGNESSFESFVNNRKLYNLDIKLKGAYDLGFRQC